MTLTLQSYQSILGKMVASLLANSDITAVRPGSVGLTIMEAAAANDFSQEGRLLQLLTIRSVDSAQGVDLDNLAKELGLIPARIGAQSATASLTIKESAFSKINSLVFSGAAAPAAGDTTLLVTDASGFTPTGTIYLGRGTATSESVIYSSKANIGLCWALTLSSSLSKNHLIGEEVILGQGGARSIPSGTTARVPASGGQSAINFKTSANYVLLDGEDTITGVLAVANVAGLAGNVAIGQIKEFTSAPWSTATVTNASPATGGLDTETDSALRQRIRNWVHNLGRGTERAIVTSVVGATDADENKRVVSAFLVEPTEAGKLGTLYIDDGTGYQPPFAGVGLETLVSKATGGEKRVQFQQYPMVKSQAASVSVEPYAAIGGEFLRIVVDGVSEERALDNTTWRAPGTVTAQEIAETINATFLTIESRAKDGQLFITPVTDDPNYLQVTDATQGINANSYFNFPTRKINTVNLFINDVLVDKNGSPAQIQSLAYGQWLPLSSSETAIFTVDGIVGPTLTITDADFVAYSSSSTLAAASIQDWIKVLSKRVAGVTVTDNGDGSFIMSSNKGTVTGASIAISGGTLNGLIFESGVSSSAVTPGFTLNRLLGQLELITPLSSGDNLKAGNTLTAGFVVTPASSAFDLSDTLGSEATIVVVPEGVATLVSVPQTLNPISFSSPTAYTQRITGVSGEFSNVRAGDWCHLYNLPAVGLYRVFGVAANGSYVDLWSPNPVASGTATPDGVTISAGFFRMSGAFVGLPFEVKFTIDGAASSASVIADFNSQAIGAIAELLDTGAIRFRSICTNYASAFNIPIIIGKATSLGITAGSYANGDPSVGVAESGDLLGLPYGARFITTPDLTAPYNTFNSSTFSSTYDVNRPVVIYAGSDSKQYREVENKSGAAVLTLRDGLIVPSVGLGPDLAAAQAMGLEFGQADNMVFILDNDPTRKTFDIPMYVDFQVAAPSTPTNTQFDLIDASGQLIGSSAKWYGHRFNDYRVWFQAYADVSVSVAPPVKLMATAVQYGPNGELIQFGINYPSAPSSSTAVSYSINETTGKILVSVNLPGGSERTTGVSAGQYVKFSGSLISPNHYSTSVRFHYPVNLSNVLIGDVCSLNDSAINTNNKGVYKVLSTTNFTDATKSWSFPTETAIATVSGGSITFNVALTEPLRANDLVTVTGYTDIVVSSAIGTVVTLNGASFAAGAGTFTCNAVTFTYTAYSNITATFSGVSPDPSAIVTAGSTITQAITPVTGTIGTVTSQSLAVVSVLSAGVGYSCVVSHGCLKASTTPNFTALAGDWVQAGGYLLTILTIIDSNHFTVDTPFAFTGTTAGQLTRIIANLDFSVAPTAETDTLTNTTGIRFYAVGTASSTDVVTAVNNTAGAKDVLVLSGGTGNILSSTQDFLRTSAVVTLANGEGFVLSCANASPALTLKSAIAQAPLLGDKVKLIPMTPRNIASHFSRAQISGLSVAANVELIDGGRKVQVSTIIPGGEGQVYPVGGRASGSLTMAVNGNGRSAGSFGVVPLDKSAITSVAPGQTITLSQTGLSRKGWVGSSPTGSTNATVTLLGGSKVQFTLGVPLAATISYTHTGTITWRVVQIARGRYRFHTLDPAASVSLSSVSADCFVLIGDSSSYAGSAPNVFFSAGNRGWHKVVGAGTRYFDIDADLIEELVSCNFAPFVFTPYYSALPGDQLVITNTSALSLLNQGTFTITQVNSTTDVQFVNAVAVNQGPIAIGDATSVGINDQGFLSNRTVVLVAPDPSSPATNALLYFTPATDANVLNAGASARVGFPNRLDYTIAPIPGVSGYQYWTGLKRTAQRVIDGWSQDPNTYPGVRAAGAAIEAREPQIQRVSISIKIRTNNGVSLTSISDSIKSAVVGYVNSLQLGNSVVLSNIVALVQAQSGVDSVVLVNPILENEIITIGDKSVARTSPSSITLSNA